MRKVLTMRKVWMILVPVILAGCITVSASSGGKSATEMGVDASESSSGSAGADVSVTVDPEGGVEVTASGTAIHEQLQELEARLTSRMAMNAEADAKHRSWLGLILTLAAIVGGGYLLWDMVILRILKAYGKIK
jgi:hypothetical protein